jgi:branched-chain amino acid transport system ATP-binding protein
MNDKGGGQQKGRREARREGERVAEERTLDSRLRLVDSPAYPEVWGGSGARVVMAVRDLVVGYGGDEVLHGVNLEVRQGEIVTLVGLNGAGKTTLVNTICGLLRPASGSIEFMEEQIAGLSSATIVAGGIAQVPQGRKLFNELSVEDNLLLGAHPLSRRERRVRMAEVMELYPILKERQKDPAGSLSGLEQETLAVGRALVTRPRLVLLDEPFLGLSGVELQEMARLVTDISERGLTVLVTAQLARPALEMAHRGYIMEHGRLLTQGSAASLMDDRLVKARYLPEA